MAAAGTMTVQFSDEDRAAIASAEDVIKRQDAKIAEIERIADRQLKGQGEQIDRVEANLDSAIGVISKNIGDLSSRVRALEFATPEAALDLSEGIGEQAAHIRALGDRMTALEKMLTGYVADLNALADRHSAYMMETRAMVERLDKRLACGIMDEWKRHVARVLFGNILEGKPGLVERFAELEQATGDPVERRGEVWRLVAPEIYEGLPRDITAPIGAIIQGLSERVDGLEESRNIGVGIAGHQQSTIEALAGNVGREIADLRASVKVLGEDITAVGDRLGDHLTAGRRGRDTECVPAVSVRSNTAIEERLGNIEMRLDTIDNYLAQDTAAASAYVPAPEHANDHPAWMDGKGGNFDHDYLSRACEQAVAELAADLVKRVKQIARAADADEVPF